MNIQKTILTIGILLQWFATNASAQTYVETFEALPVPASGFYNGDINASAALRENFRVTGTRDNFGSQETLQLWELGGSEFFNGYTEDFGSWNGWSWSDVVDPTTAGFANQYASYPGGGSNGLGGISGGENYAVGFGNDAFIDLPDQVQLTSFDLTNTTYSALSMLSGDGFGKKFGGDSGDDPDFLKVVFTGFSGLAASGAETGSVEVFLADYRSANNILLDSWNTVDTSGLGNARSVQLAFVSTDFGTPTYVAMDNLVFTSVPEPSSTFALLAIAMCVSRSRRRK